MNLKKLGIFFFAIFCGWMLPLEACAEEFADDAVEFTDDVYAWPTDLMEFGENAPEDSPATEESMGVPPDIIEAIDTIPIELVSPLEIYTPEMMNDPALAARMKDVDTLARLVQKEDGSNCISFTNKVGTALVALHRIDSPLFPNTLDEVIKAPRQFAKPVKGEIWYKNRLAAEYAMRLWESGLSYSFLPEEYLYFTGHRSQKYNVFKNKQGERYEVPNELIRVPGMETLFQAYR